MIQIDGQNFETLTQGSSVIDGGNIVSGAVGSRACVRYTGSSAGRIYLYPDGYSGRENGNLTAHDDADPKAGVFEAEFCLEAVAGSADVDFAQFWCNGIAGSPVISCVLRASVAAGVATIYARYTYAGAGGTYASVELGTASAGAFHRIRAEMYLDLARTWWDGAEKTEASYPSGTSRQAYPYGVLLDFSGNANALAAWNYLRLATERTSHTADIGISLTNGHPDNGTIYLISHAALDAAIAGGTAYALPVTDGAFSESAADGEYLLCKVLSDNSGGYGVKLARSSGAWAASAW